MPVNWIDQCTGIGIGPHLVRGNLWEMIWQETVPPALRQHFPGCLASLGTEGLTLDCLYRLLTLAYAASFPGS
jgi:hypothetical protein